MIAAYAVSSYYDRIFNYYPINSLNIILKIIINRINDYGAYELTAGESCRFK